VHTLDVPADVAPGDHLIVGLYKPATGRRAITSGGADQVVLERYP
jgi:hypothetical protein